MSWPIGASTDLVLGRVGLLVRVAGTYGAPEGSSKQGYLARRRVLPFLAAAVSAWNGSAPPPCERVVHLYGVENTRLPCTATGTELSVVVPSPSEPRSLDPQQYAAPAPVSPQVCPSPPARLAKVT